ncbi:MAG: hypothetical protein COA94_04965 [Rickettsiales bacterium]|nr:MAG: hypothetical protein COA94_04965 [Rickettsiales bacterium]
MIRFRYLPNISLTQIILTGKATSRCFFVTGKVSDINKVLLADIQVPEDLSDVCLNEALSSRVGYTKAHEVR